MTPTDSPEGLHGPGEEIGHTAGFAAEQKQRTKTAGPAPKASPGYSVCPSPPTCGCHTQGSDGGPQGPCHALLGFPFPLQGRGQWEISGSNHV